MKLTACDKIDNEAAVSEVQKIAGKLDVLIANAGMLLLLHSTRKVIQLTVR